MNTILEISGAIVIFYICTKMVEHLSYRKSYRDRYEAVKMNQVDLYEKLFKKDEEIKAHKDIIIKMWGDNDALQKLNRHHLKEIEQLKNKIHNRKNS